MYGVWADSTTASFGEWFRLGTGEIFHTTHLGVARAQCDYANKAISGYKRWRVRAFSEKGKPRAA